MSVHTTSGGSGTTSLWTTVDDGTDITATIENTRNTATTQDAIMEAKVGGTAGGNPIARLTIPGGKTWNILSDNADNDVFDIRDNATSRIKASALGVIVNSNGNPAVSAMDVRAYGISSNCWITVRSDDTAGQAGMLLNIASSNKSRLVHYGSTEGSTVFGIAAADWTGLIAANVAHNGLLVGTQGADPIVFGAGDVEAFRASAQAHLTMTRRLQTKAGANVASGTTITLGGDGNAFPITGTTAINHITTTDWQSGSLVTLFFSTAVTITHNAGAPPGGTAAILLAGAANFSATANDTLTLRYDGTNWRQIASAAI